MIHSLHIFYFTNMYIILLKKTKLKLTKTNTFPKILKTHFEI